MIPVILYGDFYKTTTIPTEPLVNFANCNTDDILSALILIKHSLHENQTNTSNQLLKKITLALPREKAIRLQSLLFSTKGDAHAFSHPTVIVKIITDIFKLPLVPADNHIEGLEEKILDVILVYNELQYREAGLGVKMNTHKLIWEIMLMQDITGFDIVHFTRAANIKHLVFLKFLKVTLSDNYEQFNSDFCSQTGIKSIYEYIGFFLNIYAFIRSQEKANKSPFIKITRNSAEFNILNKFNLIIYRTQIPNAASDVSFYITHPFFEHSDGDAYLIDHHQFAFAIEKLWLNFLFNNSSIKNLIPGKGDFNDFQSFLGKRYYESFLLLTLFKSLHKSGFRVLETDDRKLADITCILNETDIFLFEIKSSAINYKTIDSQDIDKFEAFIDINFAKGKKGARQLFNNIQNLIKESTSLYKLSSPLTKLTVYPVIIYTDYHMSKHAVNDYVMTVSKY